MANFTTIVDPSAHFQVVLYTGDGQTGRTVTNDGNSDLQPDFVWIRERSSSGHKLYDSTRGVQKVLATQSTAAETTVAQGLTAFNSDGFTVGSDGGHNQSSETYVSWQWKAAGGTTASNTDGDLTSTTQVNSTAGFSIITYTGKDPIEPLDIGHGLGAVPEVFIIKRRNGGSRNWAYYHKNMSASPQNGYLRLNNAAAYSTASTWWRNEAPTSTIIKTGEQADVNQPNDTFVVYAFKGIQGYSKFGSYEGTGARAYAPFIYLGFEPAFVIIKNADGSGSWLMFDNKRTIINGDFEYLLANTNDAESDTGLSFTDPIDFLSNGFRVLNYDAWANGSGVTYIYMAFAHHPLVTSTGVPNTAR